MDIKSRIEAFRASMEKHGIDAAWISSPENHLYLSGFAT
ncbi:MAG: aminopeptidase P family N-terminal domain-containing protein [Lachnospiraceae bacterium]